MKRTAALVTILLGVGWSAARAADDSCVACHKSVTNSASVHSYSDWEKSAHAKAGVRCQDCHGGDSTRSEKAAAHATMKSSRDHNSPVYFTKIPDTCGACHAPEIKAFKKSAHYQELRSSGRGPNCVTCHGSMAQHLLSPREMENTCALCHHGPDEAFSARAALEDSREALQRLSSGIEKGRKSGVGDMAPYDAAYGALVQRFQTMQVDWHTFDMKKVLAEAKGINKEAAASYTEVNLRLRKP